MSTRSTGWTLTAVAAVLAAVVAWQVTTRDVPDAAPVGDRVQAAVEGLRDSNVYVAPDSAGLLSDADLDRLSARAAAARPETFVVVWQDSREAGYYLASDALEQIGEELDRPGYYVSLGRGDVSSADVGIDGDYVRADGFDDTQPIDQQTVAARIDDIIDESDGREFSEADTTGSAYWGGTVGTIGAGIVLGLLGGMGLSLVAVPLWFLVRSRLRRRS